MRTIVAATLLALPSAVSAQLPVIEPGATVRVVAESDRRVGTFVSMTRDTLVIATRTGRPRRIAVTRITLLERSAGRTAGQGAVNGIKMGAAMGFGFSALMYGAGELGSELICSQCAESPTRSEIVGGLAKGTLIGALFGVGIGSVIGAHEWERVSPFPAAPAVRSLASGRLGVGVSFAF